MVKSHTKFGKPSWALEGPRGEAEQAVDFQFSVTWSSVFVPSPTPNSSNAVAPLPATHRTPTLVVTAPKEPPPDREETDLELHSDGPAVIAQPPLEANSTVSWEMVVPKMVRPASKIPAADPPTPVLAATDSPIKKDSRLQFTRLAIGVGITIVGIFLLLILHHWVSGSKQAATPSSPAPSLKLEVEPQGNGAVNVSWNPKAAAVAQARDSRLIIMERDQQPRTITLDPEQLKAGHLSFRSTTERVVLRLELVDRSGASVKESALALLPEFAASAPVQPPAEAGNKPSPANGAPVVQNNGKPKTDSAPSSNGPIQANSSRPPARAFTPPNKIGDPGERPAVLLDPPSAIPTASNVAPIRLPEPSTRISPPSVKQVLAPGAPPAPAIPVKVGGNLQAAKLLKKVTPVYPQMAALSHLQGAVRLTALIAKDGTVKNVQLVSGPTVLGKSALDAVKQWVYQPTILNGEPVEVQTQIDVNFNLNQ